MDGNTDSMDMSLSKLQEMMKDREGWSAAVYGVTKSHTITYITWYINCNSKKIKNKTQARKITWLRG